MVRPREGESGTSGALPNRPHQVLSSLRAGQWPISSSPQQHTAAEGPARTQHDGRPKGVHTSHPRGRDRDRRRPATGDGNGWEPGQAAEVATHTIRQVQSAECLSVGAQAVLLLFPIVTGPGARSVTSLRSQNGPGGGSSAGACPFQSPWPAWSCADLGESMRGLVAHPPPALAWVQAPPAPQRSATLSASVGVPCAAAQKDLWPNLVVRSDAAGESIK